MKQGTLSERYLKNSVFQYIKKADANLLVGAGVGNDYSLVRAGGIYCVTADGTAHCPTEAFYKAQNNFLCSLGICEYARITMLLPKKVKESEIKSYMDAFEQLAKEAGVQIVGGHSEVSEDFNRARFTVTLLGSVAEEKLLNRKEIRPGYDIVFAGYAGILGTNHLLAHQKEALAERFSSGFLDGVAFSLKSLSIKDVIQVMQNNKLAAIGHVCYIHDVSSGGIYQSLWQLGEGLHRGFLIDNGAISIRQETIEICEFLDYNPYFLDGTGGVLLVCEKGNALAEALRENGITARVIGQITEDKERRVKITDQDIRTLSSEGEQE